MWQQQLQMYITKQCRENKNLLHWRRSIKHVWRVEIRWTVGEWRWRQKKTSIVILLTIKQSTNKQQYYSSKIHSQQIKQQWPEDRAEWTHPGSRRVTADNQHPSRRDVGPAMLSKVKKVKNIKMFQHTPPSTFPPRHTPEQWFSPAKQIEIRKHSC